MEEWRDDVVAFASTIDPERLEWKNIGTPDDERFRTSTFCLNFNPPNHDPTKPVLQEYAPWETHELRECYMVLRIKQAMERYEAGLLVVGLGHMHSMMSKLMHDGFQVRGYSWMGG